MKNSKDINTLTFELSLQKKKNEQLQEEINRQQLILAELQASTSWRITSPLRFFKHQTIRTKIVLKRILNSVEQVGGPAKFMLRIFQKVRQGQIKLLFHKLKNNSLEINQPQEVGTYQRWLQSYDTLTDKKCLEILNTLAGLKQQPLISIILPVYNPPIQYLKEAIESVQEQLYQNWELCIADDASSDPQVKQILEQYSQGDARIKVCYRKTNGHISKASNSAIDLANGDFIALLDNDDLLSKDALAWVVKAINDNPGVKLIYSDEDKMDISGQRNSPYFKTDWNLDLFLSQNMFCHLGVYDTALIKKIQGFRSDYDGAQDYDLVLRCLDHISKEQIHHIPKILYHWRSIPGSTATDINGKPYAMLAGERAINDYLVRNHIDAQAEFQGFGYRISYKLPKQIPLVSLIIPTHNGADLLKVCIQSIIEKTNYKHYEMIIIDNNSDDEDALNYFNELSKIENIRLIKDKRPFNYSALNNNAVKQARGEIIGLLNNDTEIISENWMDEMVSHALRENVGAVGAKLLYPNKTVQHAGVILGIGGVAGHIHLGIAEQEMGYFGRAALTQSFSAVTAACLFVKKDKFIEVGGLDEENLAIAFNDVDFCLKLQQAGYKNIWTPYALLFHHESATRGLEDTKKKQKRFQKESEFMQKSWQDILLADPAYNPNLSLNDLNFSLAFPPRNKFFSGS